MEQTVSPTRAESLLSLLRPVQSGFELLRVGGEADGGYLIPDDSLDEIAQVVSPGVGESVSFEEYFASKGIRCDLFDGTVEPPLGLPENIFFHRKNIGVENSDEQSMLLEETLGLTENFGDKLLQMDIEGGEWEVLAQSSSAVLTKFRIIVVEFHELHSVISSKRTFDAAEKIFLKILKDFAPVHVHVNNCCGQALIGHVPVPRYIEVTFLRKDRLKVKNKQPEWARIPHPLDEDCVPSRKSANVPRYWRTSTSRNLRTGGRKF